MMKALIHFLKLDKYRLYKIDEVESYLRSNPFIRSGYRGNMSMLSCIRSTLALHNETVNIWTHLLGFVVFLALLVKDFVVIPLYDFISFADLCVLAGVLFCYQACMFLSSLFHTFTCHSQHVSEKCLSLDLAGITLALLASYLSGIYYAFWCHPETRDFYLLTVGGIFVIAAGFQLSPKFSKDEYAHLRIGLFTIWGIYGFIPTIHWIWLHGGFAHGMVPVMLPRIFVMYGLCGMAFVFYISKFPERILPGFVDYIGHSHNIWHVLIFAALLFWHQTGVNFALFRLSTGCKASLSEDELDQMRIWPF
jgi:predicted membrane channel-forming protein YqfA (hemolysin III family)